MTNFEKECVAFVSGYMEAGVSAEDYVKAFAERLLDVARDELNSRQGVKVESVTETPKDILRDLSLEAEIKRYTEEQYHETFGHGQGTLNEFDWEDIAVTIEETAVHFVEWKEEAPEYKTISKILALGFMHCLDENRQEGKMCLSNAECEDITKAVSEQDWIKLERYAEKYVGGCGNKHHNDEPNCESD